MYLRRKRRDASHKPIVEALRKVGASVVCAAELGNGIPDLIVGFRGVTRWLEVKSGSALKPEQIDFAATWRGGDVRVVTTPDEALRAIGAIADVAPPY